MATTTLGTAHGAVVVQVIDRQGKPIANASVRLEPIYQSGSIEFTFPVDTAPVFTDAGGKVSLNPAVGDHQIIVAKTGFHGAIRRINVTGRRQTVTFRLQQSILIREPPGVFGPPSNLARPNLMVRTVGDHPIVLNSNPPQTKYLGVPSINVAVRNFATGKTQRKRTDRNGNANFVLTPGDYEVVVQRNGIFRVARKLRLSTVPVRWMFSGESGKLIAGPSAVDLRPSPSIPDVMPRLVR